MNSRATHAFLYVLFTALAAAGCSSGEDQNALAPPAAPDVTAARVIFDEVRNWAEFTGRLEPVNSVDLHPRVRGYVESVALDEGAMVERGDLLFEIDARPYRAEVDRLRAERELAAAELDLARTFAERAARLLASNATSQEDFDRLTADEAIAEARLASVAASLEAAEIDLSYTKVTAPITGRVSRAIVTEGNLVEPSTLLTTLVSTSPVYVYFDVDEHTYLETVNPHGAADVYIGLIDEEGYPHQARLDFIDNRVDAGHGTIRARAVLDDPDSRFVPGLFARVRLVAPKAFSAAFVDDRAIGTDLGRKFVLVVDDQSVVQYRAVETGRLLDGLRIVESGLEPGEVIVVNGLQRVRPGMTVTTTRVAMDRRVLGVLAASVEPGTTPAAEPFVFNAR